LVQTLSDGSYADAPGCSVFERYVLGDFGVDTSFGFDVLGEGAVGVVSWVTWDVLREDIAILFNRTHLHGQSQQLCRQP
jgi:hypothetical protein